MKVFAPVRTKVTASPNAAEGVRLAVLSLRLAGLLLVLLNASADARAQVGSEEMIRARVGQAASAISKGELAPAESLLTSVLAVRPRDADALNLLGVVKAQQQRPAEAERLFRRAAASSPRHLGARLNLGELLLTTGRVKDALPVLLAAHGLAPARPDVNLRLATVYGSLGQHARALEHLGLISRREGGSEWFLLELESLLKLDRREEAHRLAREFAESGLDEAEAFAKFALLLAGGGLGGDALELLEEARPRHRNSFQLLYALGVVNAAAGRRGPAEDYLTQALRLRPDDVLTLRALARTARETGELEKALAHLVNARRLAPDSPGVLYDFGATALQMDLLLDALQAFERLQRLRPGEPAYIYALAAAHLKKGEAQEAARLLKSYTALRPSDAAGFYLLGDALHSLKDYQGARAALELSLRLKADPDVEYLLGSTLNEEGKYGAAVETLLRVVGLRRDHAPAHAALGAAYFGQGAYAEACAALERAVALDPKDLRATYQLGLVYAKQGDREAAKRMLDRAEELRGQQRNRESVILKLVDPPQN